MPVTMKQLLGALLPEEPDYPWSAAELGPDVLPLLEQLVSSHVSSQPRTTRACLKIPSSAPRSAAT